jgi:hypothetical protein
MSFVADVSIPDGTVVYPGTTFTKTWRVKNTGTTTWSTSYSIRHYAGDSMGASASYALPTGVDPNATIDISVGFTAPSTSGDYISHWVLSNDKGQNFGVDLYVKVTVGNAPSSTATTAAATATTAAATATSSSTTVTATP